MNVGLDGLLLIDKPSGITSHDAVDVIRRRFGIRRVGHAGTLDPAATGLLILLIGAATRRASEFLGMEKSYLATLCLGVTTDTQDAQGKVLESRVVGPRTLEEIRQACAPFQGEIDQEIPAYSAVWIQGRRSYELARAGQVVPRRVRKVTIRELEVLEARLPEMDLAVTCSKGTYIRSLCADLGAALGCGGHLAKLRRTRIGPFSVDQAVSLEQAQPEDIIPVDCVIASPERSEGRSNLVS